MIKIKTLEIAGLGSVLQSLRLPFGKECRSFHDFNIEINETDRFKTSSFTYVNEKDLHLLSTLVKRGDEHAKVLRGLVVYAEIDAPIWFYRELETYRIGRERLSSESTMHIDCKGLSGEELEKAKDAIPMGKIQKTVDMFSYQCLRRIYFQRRNHRLPMWHSFCRWIETLPYANELILCRYADTNNE
jgi:hypothetical protein